MHAGEFTCRVGNIVFVVFGFFGVLDAFRASTERESKKKARRKKCKKSSSSKLFCLLAKTRVCDIGACKKTSAVVGLGRERRCYDVCLLSGGTCKRTK